MLFYSGNTWIDCMNHFVIRDIWFKYIQALQQYLIIRKNPICDSSWLIFPDNCCSLTTMLWGKHICNITELEKPAVLHPSWFLTLEWTSIAADCIFISPWIMISVGRSHFHQPDHTHFTVLSQSRVPLLFKRRRPPLEKDTNTLRSVQFSVVTA